jgi:nucleoside-triphosphatase
VVVACEPVTALFGEQGGDTISNIFLTGDIRIGKSALIDRAVDGLRLKAGGFKTLRHYSGGEHDGFVMEDLNEEKVSPVNRLFVAKKGEKGRWKDIPETFEGFGVDILRKSLSSNIDLIIMDELGYFESNALNFQKQVFKCLSASLPVLGVVKKRSTAFLDRIRAMENVIVLPVTMENRDNVGVELCGIMMELLARRPGVLHS